MIERLLTDSLNRGKAISRNTSEYGDHLSITVVGTLQPLADFLHRSGQNPFAERSAVAQSTRFAREDRNIVSRIIDGLAPAKAAPVFSDRHSILFDDEPISTGMNFDGAANGSR